MFDRLYNIARAYIGHQFRSRTGGTERDTGDYGTYEEHSAGFSSRSEGYSRSESSTSNSYGVPDQVVEDLAVFGLKPPSSLGEVVKARNREMKRYHPDRYMREDEKRDAANEIAQMYNTAFERLEQYFEGK